MQVHWSLFKKDCRHRVDQEFYAVKIISLPFPPRDDEELYFQEVRLVTRLVHPNIVLYRSSWIENLPESRERFLMVQMEYCDLGTLRSVLDSKTLSKNVNVLWEVISGCLKGLEYLHAEGFIHRDIQPVNTFSETLSGTTFFCHVGVRKSPTLAS